MRTPLLTAYAKQLDDCLKMSGETDQDKIDRFIDELIKTRYRPRKVDVIDMDAYALAIPRTHDVVTFLNQHNDHVLTPNGCVYKGLPKGEISATEAMLMKMKKERKASKARMFAAQDIGDTLTEQYENFIQANIKINMNALPGGFGSSYNIFYNKPNYNSITAIARSLIANAYTCAEQALGGNFAFYTEEMVINYLVIYRHRCPESSRLFNLLHKYKLKTPTRQNLYDFFKSTLSLYNHSKRKYQTLLNFINRMSRAEIAFYYYLNNLRHLIWENEATFRPWIDRMMPETWQESRLDQSELEKFDGDMLTAISTAHGESFDNIKPQSLAKKTPERVKSFIGLAEIYRDSLNQVEELWNTFIYHDVSIPSIFTKKKMLRNTVVLSDTDSVIFTSNEWVQWYTGDNSISKKGYHIASLTTYWLTKLVAHTLTIFSKDHGAKGDDVNIMEMKNEFLYPVLLVFPIKKTYAALCTLQEGNLIIDAKTKAAKPKLDIKGGALRGSSSCADTIDFVNRFIRKLVLEPAEKGKISASKLIQEGTNFEYKIYSSLNDGSTDYCKMSSLREKEEYTDEHCGAIVYTEAWQAAFATKYGDLTVPTKTALVPLLPSKHPARVKFAQDYPEINRHFNEVIRAHGKKDLTFIAINPLMSVIPKELRTIIDYRRVVHHNLRPVYLILEALGVNIPYNDNKNKVLLLDVYRADNEPPEIYAA